MSNFVDNIGGRERLHAIVEDFYGRVLEDPLIGFMFDEEKIDRIIERQVQYLMKHLGEGDVEYEGESIRAAHRHLPITSGHVDRRHRLLEETLDEWEMPEETRRRWLKLDASLRELVMKTGKQRRDELTGEQ